MFDTVIDTIRSWITGVLYGGAVKVDGQWYFITAVDNDNDEGIFASRTKYAAMQEIEYFTKKLYRFNRKVEHFTVLDLYPETRTIAVSKDVDIPYDSEIGSLSMNPITDLVSLH